MPEKLARSVVVTPCCRHHSLTERPLLRHSWICAAHSCSSARCFNSALVILTPHNTTVAKPFATFRYYCLMCVQPPSALTVTILGQKKTATAPMSNYGFFLSLFHSSSSESLTEGAMTPFPSPFLPNLLRPDLLRPEIQLHFSYNTDSCIVGVFPYWGAIPNRKATMIINHSSLKSVCLLDFVELYNPLYATLLPFSNLATERMRKYWTSSSTFLAPVRELRLSQCIYKE